MTLQTLSDADLVGRCREADQAAWAELVERFSRYVYAIAVRVYRLEESEAEDVFQEVFARTYEHLDRLRDDAAIKPWIATLTRRLSIDRLRARGREMVSEDAGVDEPAPEVFDRLDEALAIRGALADLPSHCGEILDRFFCRDESYRAIGAELDIAPGTIASRISRCLAKMREKLEGRSQAAVPSGGNRAGE
jgi:RNA polymerase sigma-70 factor (ECF subfamily)